MKHLLVAPFNLHSAMMDKIRSETANARAGNPAGIYAKMNSLVDEKIIGALYEASAAGVPVRLLVRGICCLRPGMDGLSENIRVRSIVGRFLEHSRIFRFENGGDPEIYIGSADWMPRNFYRRVESCIPLRSPAIRARAEAILESCWRDDIKARELGTDGNYSRGCPRGGTWNSQEEFVRAARAAAERERDSVRPIPAMSPPPRKP